MPRSRAAGLGLIFLGVAVAVFNPLARSAAGSAHGARGFPESNVEACMIHRIAVVFLAFSWLPDCKGEGAPGGSLGKFLAPFPYKPGVHAQMCSNANDGKRFWLEGYLQLPNSIRIEKGKTSLYFYDRIDGKGQGSGGSISVDVSSPGDIDDLWSTATAKKPGGFRSQKGEIDPDALRIRAKNGEATARDKIKLTFHMTVLKNYQSGEISACTYQFVKAEKV